MHNKTILRKIVKKLIGYNVNKILLFGSAARGESDDISDIDIVVIKDTTDDFFERIRKIMNLLDMKRAIDILVYTPAEFEEMKKQGNVFIETIEQEGILLYDRCK